MRNVDINTYYRLAAARDENSQQFRKELASAMIVYYGFSDDAGYICIYYGVGRAVVSASIGLNYGTCRTGHREQVKIACVPKVCELN